MNAHRLPSLESMQADLRKVEGLGSVFSSIDAVMNASTKNYRKPQRRTLKRAYFSTYEVASLFRQSILNVRQYGENGWKKYFVELTPRVGGGTVVTWTPSVEALTNNG